MLRSSPTSIPLPSDSFPPRWRGPSLAAGPVRVLRWSAALRRRTLASPRAAGRVHSIFEHTLNILWHDGGLITLHGPAPLAAPFAAAIPRLPRPGSLAPDTRVFRRGSRILVGPFALDTERGALVDTMIHPAEGALDLLAPVLRGLVMPPAAPGLSSPGGLWAQRRLADGIRNRDARTFVEGARALVGLGEGLTPAGDDLLVGSLAVLHRARRSWLTAHPEVAVQIAAAARSGTTMVGRDFILHALVGTFSETMLRLVAAATESDARLAAAALAGTGGTSGADTLAGMRMALEALAP